MTIFWQCINVLNYNVYYNLVIAKKSVLEYEDPVSSAVRLSLSIYITSDWQRKCARFFIQSQSNDKQEQSQNQKTKKANRLNNDTDFQLAFFRKEIRYFRFLSCSK